MWQFLSQPKPSTLRERLWTPPDPMLVEEGANGERLVARIRLLVTGLLLLIPAVNITFWGFPQENLIGLYVALTAFLFSVGVSLLVARDFYRPWLGFATSAFDVTLISAELIVLLLLETPHAAVNSKVVFECYFLAIGATALRYDVRVCMMAGLLALGEYAAIALTTDALYDLNSDAFAPFSYGMFSWQAQLSRLILLLTATSLSIAVVFRAKRLRLLSILDRLTQLFNRGYFDERIEIEVGRARRYRQPLSVAMIDVDHFKLFNDTYGHAAGDAALQLVAARLRRSFRQSDILARYGGEEFIVVLPETDLDGARQKLEMIRQQLAETPFQLPEQEQPGSLTISAGVACLPDDGQHPVELISIADGRLFAAKKGGRNRVVGGKLQLVETSVM